MKTYPIVDDEHERMVAFEIENAYISLSGVAAVLSAVESVSQMQRRRPLSRWDEIHIRFLYHGAACVVWEPFGDNSRYWIGQENRSDPVDVSELECAFRDHQPPLHRRILGDIVTLGFITQLFRRGEK